MRATGEKQFLYSICLPRLRAAAAFLLLFYVLADVTVIEYFSGNAALGIPSYNKVVALDSTASEFAGIKSVQSSPDESRLPGSQKSGSSSDDEDDCFLCCAHMLLGYSGLNVSTAPALPVIAQKSTAFFSRRQRHSDSHPPPFYRPPRFV